MIRRPPWWRWTRKLLSQSPRRSWDAACRKGLAAWNRLRDEVWGGAPEGVTPSAWRAIGAPWPHAGGMRADLTSWDAWSRGDADVLRQRIAAAARGELRCFGLAPWSFPALPDWLADGAGGTWPPLPWRRLNRRMFDGGFAGSHYSADIRLNWELNKHAHWPLLAAGWRLTRDRRLLERLDAEVGSWLDASRLPYGPHWQCPLNIAHRLLNWTLMLDLLAGTVRQDGRFAEVRRRLYEQARFVDRHYEFADPPSNHLIADAAGVLIWAAGERHLREAEPLAATAQGLLEAEIERQFLEDGLNWEQSSGYHRYALEWCLLAADAARRRARPLSPTARERLDRAADALALLTGPDGLLPNIGDADGARVDPFALRPFLDGRETIALAARVLDHRLDPAALDAGLRHFARAGLVVARSDDREGHQVIFDCGPVSMGPEGGAPASHGHGDTLQLLYCLGGRRVLVDPGSFTYTGPGLKAWHDALRRPRGHNTLLIDDREFATPTAHWTLVGRPRLQEVRVAWSPPWAHAAAAHDGYAGSFGLLHRREWLFHAAQGRLVVRDHVQGRPTRRSVSRIFQFAPDLQVQRGADGWEVWDADGLCFRLALEAGDTVTLARGQVQPEPAGWFSADYGQRQPATRLCVTRDTAVPTVLTMQFIPAGLAALSGAQVEATFAALQHASPTRAH